MKYLLVAITVLVACVSGAQIIPSTRIIDWTQAGVSNLDGIRASRTVFTNMIGLDPTGTIDASGAIQNAINLCPSNQIVVIPDGRFKIVNGLLLWYNKNFTGGYITLMGTTNSSGSNLTTLAISQAPFNIASGGQSSGQSNNIVTSSLTQNCSNFFLSSATADFVSGDLLQLARQDEAATNWVLSFNNDGLTNSDIALLKIGDLHPSTNFSATMVGLTPIALTNDSQSNAYMIFCTNGLPSPTWSVVYTNGAIDGVPTNIIAAIFTNGVLYQSQMFIPNGGLQGFGQWYRNSSADVFQQYVMCTGIVNGTNVSFWPPLYLDWTNSNPTNLYSYCKKVVGQAAYVGIENLNVTNAVAPPGLSSVLAFSGNYNCWVENCQFQGYGSPLVFYQRCLNVGFRSSSCVLNYTNNICCGDVTGLEFNNSCAFRCENSFFSGYWSAIILENSASGGVIAYNYFTNEYQAANVQAGDFQQQPDLFLAHIAYDAMNDVEGNVFGSGIQADDFHGSSGYATLFRNYIIGANTPYGVTLTNNIRGIDFVRYSYYNNVVGNVIGGSPAVPWSYVTPPIDGTYSVGNPTIYRFGFTDEGNNCVQCTGANITYNGPGGTGNGTGVSGYPISYDLRVTNTLFRVDNYDAFTGGIADGTTNLPASLIYNAKPIWWGNKTWPIIGPDLSPRTGTIPAQDRFNGVPVVAPKGIPTSLLF